MDGLMQDIAEESAAISRILELSAARRIQKNAARLNILLAIVAIPQHVGLAALYADPIKTSPRTPSSSRPWALW